MTLSKVEPLDPLPDPVTGKRPIKHLRWYIAILLCFSIELNYLDRQTLSVLATTIQADLGLSNEDYARINRTFLFSYSIMYLVGGRLMDYLGTRRGLLIFVSAWSVAGMLHALSRNASQLMFFRFLLGATEAANIPAGVKTVSEWFPLRERALAVGIFNAGTAIGATVAAPVVSTIALAFGWRAAFVITGAVGFVWVVAWALFYRTPAEHKRLGAEERQLILGDAGKDAEAAPPKVPLRTLMRMRATWGCVFARVLTDPVSYFLSFWVMKYLQDERGFTLADIGKYGWIPYVALALGNVASGAIPRFLISRGWALNRARKSTILAVSCAMPLLAYAISQVRSPALAIALLAGLMFGHAAWGNIILPAEVFPKHVVGTVTGLGGCLGGLTGAFSQMGIATIVGKAGFGPVFAVASATYLIAFILVVLLIGELGRIREIPAPRTGGAASA